MFPSPKITNENVLQIVGISADAHNAENWEDEFDLDSAGNNALGLICFLEFSFYILFCNMFWFIICSG